MQQQASTCIYIYIYIVTMHIYSCRWRWWFKKPSVCTHQQHLYQEKPLKKPNSETLLFQRAYVYGRWYRHCIEILQYGDLMLTSSNLRGSPGASRKLASALKLTFRLGSVLACAWARTSPWLNWRLSSPSLFPSLTSPCLPSIITLLLIEWL